MKSDLGNIGASSVGITHAHPARGPDLGGNRTPKTSIVDKKKGSRSIVERRAHAVRA
jgi:hypothetical protein